MIVAAGLPASRAADSAASAKPGPQAEAFYCLQGELNAVLAELANLQIEYRTAGEDKQATIKQQWKELIAQGKTIEPKLLEAAKKAYAESSEPDKNLTEFLVKLLTQSVQRDDYEPAAEIGRLLMKQNGADKRVANLAGIATFATNDFEAAEKYLGEAAKAGYYQNISPDDKSAQMGAVYLQLVAPYQKAWAKEETVRKSEAKADDLPRVLLVTNQGDIEVELFENQAPNTVANFIHLVKKGFYDGLTFHRVLQGFMAQGGDPVGNGTGGPGYSIACECYRPDARQHFRGTLSMAHAGRDTGGSQFFLTFVPTPHLDGKHTAFGRVIRGMDVLAKLQRRDPSDAEAPRADKIIEAKVVRKRPHDYLPQQMPE
jgi:cyclophilin family peptidyl-prolyl cis-trans isomerase